MGKCLTLVISIHSYSPRVPIDSTLPQMKSILDDSQVPGSHKYFSILIFSFLLSGPEGNLAGEAGQNFIILQPLIHKGIRK